MFCVVVNWCVRIYDISSLLSVNGEGHVKKSVGETSNNYSVQIYQVLLTQRIALV